MTKLLEQAMGKIREMPQADQDRAAEFLFAHAARHSGPKKRDEETPAAIREGVAQAERGGFVSEAEMEAFFARHR
jgi:predicted transcriptional regulator